MYALNYIILSPSTIVSYFERKYFPMVLRGYISDLPLKNLMVTIFKKT